jgi:thioredoxin 1
MALEFTDANFEEEVLKESEKPVLVDFWAPWCGPCQMMGPILDELSTEVENFAKVGKVNVDENPETAGQYQVMSIPTLIIFKDGKPAKQMTGVQSKEALTEELKNI